ncbi:hypothetical protein N7519_005354 [Penicillium mononematosum]|uniref:uncharacterized protein n=1 Tax=Penicillium mononematosum TaxID=268346 RepID=UPI00254797D8|nr:uncharacterized protein N7519_005354 [Penicillium mononematosum]KAJ6184053.1 hypothetical protein N7519_005354 [Penicillium mononematosum]
MSRAQVQKQSPGGGCVVMKSPIPNGCVVTRTPGAECNIMKRSPGGGCVLMKSPGGGCVVMNREYHLLSNNDRYTDNVFMDSR